MQEKFRMRTCPAARSSMVVQGERFRFTVLTPCLLRLEYQENGLFEDRATQCVLNRDLGDVPFQVEETERELHILTEKLHLTCTKEKFSPHSLNIRLLGRNTDFLNVWYYGEPVPHYGEDEVNLKGTARTLDGRDGPCPLQDGLMSKGGIALLDDSASLVFQEDGWVRPRKEAGTDLYFFGYGRNYKECLRDFYRLCGETPLLPRYALGNWWSRYHRYTERSYLDLMERFGREGIPFSVAVLDMDWHVVEVDPDIGSGWTGYTWNRELFPDPGSFLERLHEKGLRTALNVHPDGGIRRHEGMYGTVAREMGIDPESGKPVEFDAANPKFWEVYFRLVHEPLEREGVDFWWIDWQSGSISKAPGMDPLWMLNHYHYLDNCREGEPGLCLSRYGGPGSHRYPVGFSGDVVISWESLDFQPYFTATAANIGYTWWSHDIGGHMGGAMDHELAVRWVQFGVFSPINRLHSSNNPFVSKEPWNYPPEKGEIMRRFLRLRHELVPYLFTMNELCHSQGLPLVEPVYYEYPWEEAAYRHRNEYFFGTQLLVCPVTSPTEFETLRARTKGWLPEGLWFDFFSGRAYRGGRELTFWRRLEELPVFARAGAIVPLSGDGDLAAWRNPERLTVRIYPGGDGRFTLYEEYEREEVRTVFSLDWEEGKIRVYSLGGENRGLRRRFDFRFPCWKTEGTPRVFVHGKPVEAEWREEAHTLSVSLKGMEKMEEFVIQWEERPEMEENRFQQELLDFLKEAQIPFMQKEQIYRLAGEYGRSLRTVSELRELKLKDAVFGVVSELLWADL